jgi:SAM-dependent methyltransferase
LEPYQAGFVPGLDDIIRYKVLKTIGVRSQNWLERMIPWSLASRVVDRRHKVSAQPLARRPAHDDDAGAARGREAMGREDADLTNDGSETFHYVGDLVDVDSCDLPAMKARFLVERVPHGATVLDVGCGGGKMLRTVAAHRSDVVLLGCDIKEPEVVDDFSFALVDAADAHLPYDDASIDVVLMIDVLEHLYEPARVLAEVDRVLRPGGRLLAFVPVEGEPVSFYALFRRLFGQDLYVETKQHVQAFRYRDVDELLAGFEVAEQEYAYHALGQLMDATLCAGLRFGPVRRLFWRSSPYHGSGAARGSLVGGVFGLLMRCANALAWGESRLLRRVRLGSAGVLIDARRPGAP